MMATCEWKSLVISQHFLTLQLPSYDRDEETESETKIRMPQDDYDNMESAGKNAARKPAAFSGRRQLLIDSNFITL